MHVRALTFSLADYLDLGESTVLRKELWWIVQADLGWGEGRRARTDTGTPSLERSVGEKPLRLAHNAHQWAMGLLPLGQR